ncbi:DUF2812 domain-containing protein [Clostridium gasigenes]|uniref:DUF2812 domain-containing protein n=1 Tax=Clostridium gasigenes TaxID=94869 RepID=UPI0014382B35|nr:DUF2812 domain-containing protein [Clostridium gasigenes]NKF07095.1 DUF2812 domain-containing protein [Clostridium gasigenes]QSW19652.1 DUF2812 domain-containing protein [Clostridium gasigenes]
MIKFRWYYDKDKEEIFLNDMVAKGYAMTRFFLGVYWFEKCEPGEYTYKVDLIKDKNTKQKNEFYDLIREIDAEIVQTWGIWAFFRKKGEFELYTDNESKIEQYSRIQKTFLILALCETLIIPSQLHSYLNFRMVFSLISTILLSVICIIFFYQAYKCKRKIMDLKKENEQY